MSSDPEPEAKGWWQTLPGLLTATAGIITAITGLLLAFHQMGFFPHGSQPAAPTPSESRTAGDNPPPAEPGATPSATGPSNYRPLALPATSQVRSGDAVYQLVAARVDPYSTDKVDLHLSVRMTNNGRYPANFWAASFRLLVNGALLAPTSDLDDVVSPNSAQDGEVEFVIPANTAMVGLQMGDVGDGRPSIPLNLQAVPR